MSGFHHRQKLGERAVKNIWLFEVDGVTRLGQYQEPAGGNDALQKKPWFQAVILLITIDDDRRHAHASQTALKIIERWPVDLHTTHGVGGADLRMLAEDPGNLLPTPGILALELHPGGAHGVDLGEVL